MAALLEAAAADPEATLAPFRAEVAALLQLVGGRGLEAGLACLGAIRRELQVCVTTDVHDVNQVDPVAAVVDLAATTR